MENMTCASGLNDFRRCAFLSSEVRSHFRKQSRNFPIWDRVSALVIFAPLVPQARRRSADGFNSSKRVANGELSECCLGDNANATIFRTAIATWIASASLHLKPEKRSPSRTRTTRYIHSRVAIRWQISGNNLSKRESESCHVMYNCARKCEN